MIQFKVKQSSFLITIFLMTFFLVNPVQAYLNGDLEDSVDVNVSVKAFAGVENSNIGGNDWVDYESEEEFEQYLINRVFDNNYEIDKIIPSNGSSFTGNGAEEKWAATHLEIFSNTKFKIKATATHLIGTSSEGSLNNQLTSSSDMVYHYLFPVNMTTGPITITPEGTTETTVGQSGTNGFNSGIQKFILASKVKMPEDFWKVKAGKYKGTVIFTVEGL